MDDTNCIETTLLKERFINPSLNLLKTPSLTGANSILNSLGLGHFSIFLSLESTEIV